MPRLGGGSSSSTSTTTVTITEPERVTAANTINRILTLHLRESKKVKWAEDVVDNEHMGKKSSKRCCIFHRKKAFGESDSDESDSDNDQGSSGSKPSKAHKTKNYQRFHA